MLTALTHLSRSPLEQNIIQPLVLSLLHLCRNVVNMPPGNSQPRGDFLYHSICNWIQDNYAQPLTRESVAQFLISRQIICQNCLLSMEQCVLSNMCVGYEWQKRG